MFLFCFVSVTKIPKRTNVREGRLVTIHSASPYLGEPCGVLVQTVAEGTPSPGRGVLPTDRGQ